MDSNFKYYAFISYNHLDEKWAKKLQFDLHHYKLPTIARKEIGEDVKIRPVFRYVSNLSLGDLRKNIGKELEESKYLIVICSPNSAQPNIKGEHWVNDEVNKFIALGRKDQIIPVIVAGKPNSGDAATECFPPALRTAGIAGADFTSKKRRERRDAFLKIVAKLLDIMPDQLIRLTDREDMNRKVMTWCKLVPMLLLGVVGGFFAFDSMRTVRNYYADYVDSFGLPEGVFPLRSSELEHRFIHYRFEYRGFQYGKSPHADSADWCIWNCFGLRRRLVRVVQANSRGRPRMCETMEQADRPLIQDFVYDSDCRVREIRYGRFNGEGRAPHLEKRIELFNEGGVVNGLIKFFAGEGQLGVAYAASSTTKASDYDIEAKSEIAQHIVQRDKNGRVSQRLFLNLSGQNVLDEDGLNGFSYEYDDFGRQTLQWYLFREGNDFVRRENKKGVAGFRCEYQGQNLRRVEYVDADSRPVAGPEGWMVCEYGKFDEYGKNKEFCYYDARGNKMISNEGYAAGKLEFDDFGNWVGGVVLDIYGRPTVDDKGVAEYRREYDEYGSMTKESYYGVDGRPALTKAGFSEMRLEYDDCGNITKISYFGVDGMLTLNMDGIAVLRMEYDDRGNMTKESYYGVDGKPTLHRDGVAEIRMEYDNRGNTTKVSCYDVNGKPTLHKDGHAVLMREYDARGNITKEFYYGVDGNLTLLNTDSIAGWKSEYDARGRETSRSWIGVDGKLTLQKDGYAEIRKEYDDHGNTTKLAYYGIDGKPTLHVANNAEVRFEYDDRGNMTRCLSIGLDGKLAAGAIGAADIRIEYNERGRETRRSFFGVDGEPVMAYEDYAEHRKEYDDHGNVTRISYYGTDGKPTLHVAGNAEVRFEYDERGNMTRCLSIGLDGKLIIGANGAAEVRMEYDEMGRETRKVWMGVDGEPISTKEGYAEYRKEYDAHGHLSKVMYYGVDGKLTLHEDGNAGWIVEYDERGQEIHKLWIDVDGKPIQVKNGYAERRAEYDSRGNMTRVLNYGADGKLILDKYGVAEWRREFDSRGNETKSLYYGTDGKLTLHVDGYAGRIADYDERGRVIRKITLGVDGGPILTKDGYAEVRRAYDERGRIRKTSYFGVDGKPILTKDGYAAMLPKYDVYGEVIGMRYLDTSGKEITLHPVVVCAELMSNLPGIMLGVKEDDVVCRLESYDILVTDNIWDIAVPFKAARNTEKELVVARKMGDAYEIHSFKFPVGLMGIRIDSKNIMDYDKVLSAYMAYCENERATSHLPSNTNENEQREE